MTESEPVSAKACDQRLTQTLSPIESEVVLLKATMELIDAMVNFEVLQLLGEKPFIDVQFKTGTHHRYFSILLVDFLSKIGKESPVGARKSHADALKHICLTPNFPDGDSIQESHMAVRELSAWLDEEVDVSVQLSSLNVNPTLTMERNKFLWMCGNISKHNVLSLGRVAKKLQTLLERSGHAVDVSDALLALEDFYVRFHDDILLYHLSRIVELLNNIRWGIYTYLQPEYRRSYVPGDDASSSYSYKYPNNITSRFARECYWELMNEMRSQPYVRRFQVREVMRRRY